MDLPLSFYIISAIAITVTGISKSGFAGGLGVMNVPLLSLFVTPQFALAVMMPILIVMDVIIVWHYRKTWNGAIVMMLIPGAVFGLSLGAMTFQFMDANLIKFIIGLLALMFVLRYFLARSMKTEPGKTGRVIPFILATASGFSSFVAHAGGPPVKGILLQQKLEKSEFVGTNSVFILFMNAVKIVIYSGMGQLTAESLKTSLVLSPMLFVGIAAGTYLHKVINPQIFLKLVYVFLFIAGTKLLWDSIPNLGILF